MDNAPQPMQGCRSNKNPRPDYKDLRDAAIFPDVANEVLTLLADTVVVGHNARFDLMFLQEECKRAGPAWGPISGVCTMAMSTSTGLCVSRRLIDACDELGIPFDDHHAALADARAG